MMLNKVENSSGISNERRTRTGRILTIWQGFSKGQNFFLMEKLQSHVAGHMGPPLLPGPVWANMCTVSSLFIDRYVNKVWHHQVQGDSPQLESIQKHHTPIWISKFEKQMEHISTSTNTVNLFINSTLWSELTNWKIYQTHFNMFHVQLRNLKNAQSTFPRPQTISIRPNQVHIPKLVHNHPPLK